MRQDAQLRHRLPVDLLVHRPRCRVFVIYNVFSITAAQRTSGRTPAAHARRQPASGDRGAARRGRGDRLLGSLLGLVGGVGLAVGRQLLESRPQHPGRWAGADRDDGGHHLWGGRHAGGRDRSGDRRRPVPPVAAMVDTAFERTGSRARPVLAGAAAALGGAMPSSPCSPGRMRCCSGRDRAGVRRRAAARPGDGQADRRVLGAPVEALRGITGAMAAATCSATRSARRAERPRRCSSASRWSPVRRSSPRRSRRSCGRRSAHRARRVRDQLDERRSAASARASWRGRRCPRSARPPGWASPG